MDISKAKRVVELGKPGSLRRIFVTVWEGDRISSCVKEADEPKQYCETCEGDDALCNEFVEHLKEKGYEATEIELGELELEESLPKFLEQREITKGGDEREEQVVTSEDVGKVEEILGEPE
ncbi:hypothetical protein ES705_21520 [subsurface metagenome]|jgi:hypothetical protein